jgi:hypothetical protein
MVFRDDLITIYRVERQRVLQPPQNMAERISEWLDRLDPPLEAQTYCDPCDDGGGTTNYYYPFDSGNPDETYADTEVTDAYGSDDWVDIGFDNTATNDQNSFVNTLTRWAEAWFHVANNGSFTSACHQ